MFYCRIVLALVIRLIMLAFFSFLQGLRVLIQSEKEPSLLDSRVENFIQGIEVCWHQQRSSNCLSSAQSITKNIKQ